MTKQRPVLVTLTAVLHLVFGIPGLLFGLFSIVMQLIGNNLQMMQQPGVDMYKLNKAIEQAFPAFQTFNWATAAVGIITPTLLILGGIGLLRLESWGRSLSLLYVQVSVLYTVVAIYVHFTMIAPAAGDFFKQELAALPPVDPNKNGPDQTRMQLEMMSVVMPISFMVAPFCGLLYPIYVLIAMLMPSVRLSLAGGRPDVLPSTGGSQEDGWGRQ